MNILIANHTGTQAHLGCHATTYALEQMLRQKLRPDNIWTDSWDARRPLRRTRSLLPLVTSLGMRLPIPGYKYFREADLIVLNGEGMFYSHACHKPNSIPRQRLLEAKITKKVLGKPLWIVNHSLYSQDKKFDELIQDLYKHVDYIAVREEQTFRYLQKMDISSVNQAADAVFSLPLPPIAQQSSWENKVFLTDSSGWPLHHMPHFQEKLETFVKGLRSEGLDPAFLSIRTDKRDAYIAESLGLEYFSSSNIEEFLAHLQTARLLISGRFHANVFAILCGVPYLSFISDTYKNRALNDFIEYPLPVFDFEINSPTDVQNRVRTALLKVDDLRNHLLAQREILRKLSQYNIPSSS